MFEELGRIGVWRTAAQLSPELAVTLEQLGYGAICTGGQPSPRRTAPGRDHRAHGGNRDSQHLEGCGHTAGGGLPPHRIPASRPLPARPRRRSPGDEPALVTPSGTRRWRATSTSSMPRAGRTPSTGGPGSQDAEAAGATGRWRSPVPDYGSTHPPGPGDSGPGVLLAPDQKVVLDSDPVRARSIGRPSPSRTWVWSTTRATCARWVTPRPTFAGLGSDRLTDALVAHGEAGPVAAHLSEYLDGGPDHVAVQLLTPAGEDPFAGFTALARTLFG
jgi:hypothetical protein